MSSFYDEQDLRRYRARKRKQRDNQAHYRERLREQGIPDREDIAAGLLALNLYNWVKRPVEEVDAAADSLARFLSVGERKFAFERTLEVIRGMVERERKKRRRAEREH